MKNIKKDISSYVDNHVGWKSLYSYFFLSGHRSIINTKELQIFRGALYKYLEEEKWSNIKSFKKLSLWKKLIRMR